MRHNSSYPWKAALGCLHAADLVRMRQQ